MIDSHCHFDFPDFDHDRQQQYDLALNQGVSELLIPGVKRCHFQRQLRIAQQFDNVHLAFGLHPYFLDQSSLEDVAQLQQFVAEQRQSEQRQSEQCQSEGRVPLAIGEIGLDYGISVEHTLQRQIFETQLHIATELSLPVIIHHRKSHHDIIALLKQQRFSCGGVIHAFSGSSEIARQYVDLGFYLGIGATITYERANKTRKAIMNTGLQHLLLETDAPDMPVSGFQGQRNEPQRLPLIASALAEMTDSSAETVSDVTTDNFKRLFNIN